MNLREILEPDLKQKVDYLSVKGIRELVVLLERHTFQLNVFLRLHDERAALRRRCRKTSKEVPA